MSGEEDLRAEVLELQKQMLELTKQNVALTKQVAAIHACTMDIRTAVMAKQPQGQEGGGGDTSQRKLPSVQAAPGHGDGGSGGGADGVAKSRRQSRASMRR